MKKILILGSGGFIGKNLCEYLSDNTSYSIFAPSSLELNAVDENSVTKYLKHGCFDVVIHSAIYNPRTDNKKDQNKELEYDLRMFFNFEKNQHLFGKMFYLGSGAEFDKKEPMIEILESDFPRTIPGSDYGLAKYIINKQIQKSTNIYNLRIFGLFGKYENWKKTFISGACCKALKNLPITIRRNVYFDYLFIDDFCKIMIFLIESKQDFREYNVCTGNKIDLLSIAEIIKKVSGKTVPIFICEQGYANEYTANNRRLLTELNNFEFMPIEHSIDSLYTYYKKNEDMIDLTSLLYS